MNRKWLLAALPFLASLASCATIQADQAEYQKQQQQLCQGYGLTPGTSPYIQCVS